MVSKTDEVYFHGVGVLIQGSENYGLSEIWPAKCS